MSDINISGIPSMGFMGGGGGVFGGNAATGQPAMSAGQINASMGWNPNAAQFNPWANTPGGFGGQTDYYSGLGASYGRATGGFGAVPSGGGGGDIWSRGAPAFQSYNNPFAGGVPSGGGAGRSVFDTGAAPFNPYGGGGDWSPFSDAPQPQAQSAYNPFAQYAGGGYNPFAAQSFAPAAQPNIGRGGGGFDLSKFYGGGAGTPSYPDSGGSSSHAMDSSSWSPFSGEPQPFQSAYPQGGSNTPLFGGMYPGAARGGYEAPSMWGGFSPQASAPAAQPNNAGRDYLANMMRQGRGWTIADTPPAANDQNLGMRINQGIYDLGNAGDYYGRSIGGGEALMPRSPHSDPFGLIPGG